MSMKSVVNSASIAISIALQGLAGDAFGTEESNESPPIGLDVRPSDLRFASKRDFGIVRNPLVVGFRPKNGRVIITDSHLHPIARHEGYLFSRDATSIPIENYKCIFSTDTFFQLADNRGHILVIRFNSPLSKTFARNKRREIYRLLANSGIREMASSKDFVKMPSRQTGVRRGGIESGIRNNLPVQTSRTARPILRVANSIARILYY